MTRREFIKFVANIAVKDWKERRIMLPSIVIAQACKESAFGTTELAVNANAIFGIKLNGWTGKSYTKKAEEQKADGTIEVQQGTLWRMYDNWEESILDHNTYIAERKVNGQTEPNFKAIVGETNIKKVLAGFVGDKNRSATAERCTDPELKAYVLEGKSVYPYATGLGYPQSLLDDYIVKYNLTQFDDEEEASTIMSKKVFLSAGHGGTDPGAVAYGIKEKDVNLQTMLSCQAELMRHGVTVICSRTTDEYDPVTQEVIEANASGADIAVSFHANAGGGDGFEGFYWSSNMESKKLAQLGEKYIKALGQNSRGIKVGNHLYFVRKTTMPAVLFETFFVDNDSDNDFGDTLIEQKAIGVAYARAILEYLGVTYTEEVEDEKYYRVQVGAFRKKAGAESLRDELKAKGYSPIIV